jgi:hypothetical protein
MKKILMILLLCGVARAEFWGPSTSGPFFTGTAESSKLGSFIEEPWYFGYFQKGSPASHTFVNSFDFGLGKDWDMNIQQPYIIQDDVRGLGSPYVSLKKTVIKDSDTNSILGVPAIALQVTNNFPNKLFGPSNDMISFQVIGHKRFKPFELYLQVGDFPLSQAKTGNGNMYNYSLAFEHVLDDSRGLGYVLELTGQTQVGDNGFSYLWGATELEVNPIVKEQWSVNFGVGLAYPIYENNFPSSYVPMTTITINWDKPQAQGE